MHMRVSSNRKGWRGLALSAQTGQFHKGRSRKHGNCGIWGAGCVSPALAPAQTEKGLGNKLSGNHRAQSYSPLDLACCPTSPSSAPAPQGSWLPSHLWLRLSIIAPQPLWAETSLCQDKGVSEQESWKWKQDWLHSWPQSFSAVGVRAEEVD